MKINTLNNPYKNFSLKNAAAVNAFIKKYYAQKIKSSPSPILSQIYSDISEYVLRDGKRIRPVLLAAASEGYSSHPLKKSEIIKLAAVLEIMHSLLLVQDDIIDMSPLRRGKKSMHIIASEKFSSITQSLTLGENIASVIADIMFANSAEIISSSAIDLKRKDAFLAMFARTYEMTAFGQILDITKGNPKKMRKGDASALEISTYKTAYYTVFYPLAMGFILSESNIKNEILKIKNFSLPLGLAFQIRDDILGVFGDSGSIGKPANSDINEGKLTLLIQNAVDLLPVDKRDEFIASFTSPKLRSSSAEKIKSMIESSGALEKTISQKKKYIFESRRLLKKLSISMKFKIILEGFIDTIDDYR